MAWAVAYCVRLPALAHADKDCSLGYAIKRAASIVGMTSCGRCAQGTIALGMWLVSVSRRSKQRRRDSRAMCQSSALRREQSRWLS